MLRTVTLRNSVRLLLVLVLVGAMGWVALPGHALSGPETLIPMPADPNISFASTSQFQNWGIATPIGPIPSARNGHRMVYDSAHSRTILFGGHDGDYLEDVWEFDSTSKTWTNVTPATGSKPASRFDHGMAYDPSRGKVVVYGGRADSPSTQGYIGDTWEWDTAGRFWTHKSSNTLVTFGLGGSQLAYDPIRNQIILFGGRAYFNFGSTVTYAWDGTNWINLSPVVSPVGRTSHSMVTDTGRSRIVMFGGYNGNLLEDTWEWDGVGWMQIATSGATPGRRGNSGMSYDTDRGVSILFGGNHGIGLLGDTWEWDGTAWSLAEPCDSPSPRTALSAMVYDVQQKKHLLFAGAIVFGTGVVTDEMYLYGSGSGIPPCGDASAPETVASVSSIPNIQGWNNSDVAVGLEAADNEGGSGVKEITYTATGALSVPETTTAGTSVSVLLTTEGETTITYFATDEAGNIETPQILVVRIDKTPPSFACDSADGEWHANDVSIACTGSDDVSELANAADVDFLLTTSVVIGTETANALTNSRTICDNAGNCETAGPLGGNMVDKKAPTVSINTPVSSVYLLNQAIAASYSCADSGSGVTACSGPVASGSNIDTATVGSATFTVNATDDVGNTAGPQSVSYTVAYGVVVLYDQTKAHKSGSTIPIKLQIVDANGAPMSSAAIVVHAVSVIQTSSDASVVLEDAGESNPDFDFRYNSSLGGTGGYIFNLKTTGYGTGSYRLNFTVGGDQTLHAVQFQVRQ